MPNEIMPGAARVPPSQTPGLSGLATLAIGVVVVAALYLGKEVFVPLVLAILLSFVLSPVVTLLRKARLPRVAAVILSVLMALALIGSAATIIGRQVADLAVKLPTYQATVEQKLGGLQEGFLGRANSLIRSATHQIENATHQASAPPNAAPATPGEEAPKAQLVRVQEPDPSPLTIARNVLGPVVEPLTTFGIVLIVVVFILLQQGDLRNRLIRLFGSDDLHRTTMTLDDAAARLGTYFLAQVGLNACFGLIIGTGLWFIGVPSPVLWGVFSALMRFVPYVGAFISAAAPLALAAAVDPGWSMVAWTAALFLITEPIMGQAVEPLLFGHATGLSPFAVIVSTLFWSFLWGPIGLILATPFTVCLVVLGRHIESLEILDVLLGDRPPLTPVENFYQRMLAGDPDEVVDLAEQMLKTRSLSSYYDEVALKGLQLAANDYARGVLTGPQLVNIKEAAQAVVDDFESHTDEEPPSDAQPESPAGTAVAPAAPAGLSRAERDLPKGEPVPIQSPPAEDLAPIWRGDAPILCIAGRGPLDEATSSMLAQLLRKHGLGGRVIPHADVARDRIAALDVSGVAMICISYLDIKGNPAHLRYLIRRLRARMPDRPILVGLWPSEHAALRDQATQTQIGADYYVTSLREGLDACLRAARAESAGSTKAEALSGAA